MGSVVLLDLMGGVALLLWGLRMVLTGVLRAFGHNLQRILGKSPTTDSRLLLPVSG
jgi:phosphate:Na+ symporter